MKTIDLTGQTFGKWSVVSRAQPASNGGARWHTKCTCGSLGVIISANLLSGHSSGCRKCGAKSRSAEVKAGTFPWWTDARTEQLRSLRAEGKSWQQCGLVVGRDGSVCRKHLLVTLLELDPLDRATVIEGRAVAGSLQQVSSDIGRVMERSPLPLPAGSPISWGAIAFHGMSYPKSP
jgi:hypothetical protein